MAEVRPLRAVSVAAVAATPIVNAPAPSIESARPQPAAALPPLLKRSEIAKPRPVQNTLDGTWDRQLARGLVAPDRTVDLHGHTLASAHAMLDGALDHALGSEARLILLITGKPPRPASERPYARGAIRAAVGDWLAGSRFADRIAAVRVAHPRHGGTGALYIVLRRLRTSRKS